jgi:hypothetical protein
VLMTDRAVRSLLVVVLVLGAAGLARLLLSWLATAGMMTGMMGGGMRGMPGRGSATPLAGIWVSLPALLVVVGVAGGFAALVWGLGSPTPRGR